MTKVIPANSRIPEDIYQKITAFTPIPCVDLVVLRKGSEGVEVLLIERKIHPEKGKWCLIGGRVIGGREVAPEGLSGAIKRQAQIELGVEVEIIPPWDEHHPAVLFDRPDADPAKYPIIAVYPAKLKGLDEIKEGPESAQHEWFDIKNLPKEIGFTHREEIEAVLEEMKKLNLL